MSMYKAAFVEDVKQIAGESSLDHSASFRSTFSSATSRRVLMERAIGKLRTLRNEAVKLTAVEEKALENLDVLRIELAQALNSLTQSALGESKDAAGLAAGRGDMEEGVDVKEVSAEELAVAMDRTRQLMSPLLERGKPKLSDKLLSRPPFRFLHDLVTELLHSTGFPGKLFTESEMEQRKDRDRDFKLGFISKLADCLGHAKGCAVDLRPALLVAGLEPFHTNVMLHGLADLAGRCSSAADGVPGDIAAAIEAVNAGQAVAAPQRTSGDVAQVGALSRADEERAAILVLAQGMVERRVVERQDQRLVDWNALIFFGKTRSELCQLLERCDGLDTKVTLIGQLNDLPDRRLSDGAAVVSVAEHVWQALQQSVEACLGVELVSIRQTQDEQGVTKEENVALSLEVEDMRTQMVELQGRLKSMAQSLSDAGAHRQGLESELDDKSSQLDRITTVSQKREETLQQRVEEVGDEVAVLEEERDAARQNEEEYFLEMKEKAEELGDAQAGYVELTNRLNDKVDEVLDLQDQMAALRHLLQFKAHVPATSLVVEAQDVPGKPAGAGLVAVRAKQGTVPETADSEYDEEFEDDD